MFLELGRTLYFILSSVTMYRHLTFCCTNVVNPVSLQKIGLDLLYKSAGFPPVIIPGSIQLRAGRDVVGHHQKMELLLAVSLVYCGQEHATGVDPHHRSRREIRDGNQGLSDQLFRLIISVNTA